MLAMHAWLAEVRDSELRDKEREGEDKKRLALRTMDIEALADLLARTSRWDDGVAPAAAAIWFPSICPDTLAVKFSLA